MLGSAIKRSRKFLSSKNFEHMDSIIEEYININYIQRAILFGADNVAWMLNDDGRTTPAGTRAPPTPLR